MRKEGEKRERERREEITMKKYFYFIGMLVLASVIMISCSKVGGPGEEPLDAIDQNDDILPTITFSKPTANQVYTSGDSIIVEGKVTDDKTLYKGKVEINPEKLWRDFIEVVKDAVLKSAKIKLDEIKAIGICTQRATILT